MKKEKGITLIALIITIIILVILAVVSVRIVTQNDIITYTRQGTEKYSTEEKKEEKIISDAEKMMEDVTSGYSGEKLNNDEENIEIEEVAKVRVTLYGPYSSTNNIIILKENGKLFYMKSLPDYSGYVRYDDENAILISENVKEFYEDGYYLTNNNELYSYSITDSDVTKNLVSENVKEYFGDTKEPKYSYSSVKDYYGSGYYTDMSDTLYYYNKSNSTNKEICKNVKDFAFARYIDDSTCCSLTNDKKLYAANGDLISENVEKIFWCDINSNKGYDCYYITSDKNVYYVRYTGVVRTWNGDLVR